MVAVKAGRRRWLIVAYTLVIQAVSLGVLSSCFALFAVPWLEEFDAPRRDVMVTIAGLQIAFGLLGPLAGRAVDKMPVRSVILTGLGMMVAGLLLVSEATRLWHVQLVYASLLAGAMALMGTLVAQALIARWFTERRGMALGISAMGTSLGAIAFPYLVAVLLALVGWRETFLWIAVICVVLVGPLTWVVLAQEAPSGSTGDGTAGDSGIPAWSTWEILGSARFWIPTLALLQLIIAVSAILPNLGVMGRDIGLSAEGAADLIALNSVGMIIGKFCFGALGDRLEHRGLYWIACGLAILAILILLEAPSKERMMVGVGLLGLAGGGILPMWGILIGSRFPVSAFGRVMGLAMFITMFSALGPIFAGWSFDATASYELALTAFLSLLVGAGVMMIWMPKSCAA